MRTKTPPTPPSRITGAAPDPAALLPELPCALVAWFTKTARDLPWRHTKDAYRIWVSEVMLQQTQVRTVIGYFRKFLDLFPTLADLAAAPEEKVLRAWEGLGYYRRARGLHASAKLLVKQGHANLPPDPELLATLPGMGEYTRNAVLSQAHGLPLPIIEANSQRVLCRILGVQEDPARGPVKKWLWHAAAKLVCTRDPGAYNQALMELGALVCSPQKPACLVCPARPWCAAAASGAPEALPLKTARPTITQVTEVCLALRTGEGPATRWLLVRRPDTASRWAGLWEFPHQPVPDDSTPEATLEEMVQGLLGKSAKPAIRHAGIIQHAITRYQVSMRVELGTLKTPRTPALSEHDASAWLATPEIASLPLSAPQRRVWNLVAQVGPV